MNWDRIQQDFRDRNVVVKAFICEDIENKLQLIEYNEDGVVSFLSKAVDNMGITESLDGGTFRYLAHISEKGKGDR